VLCPIFLIPNDGDDATTVAGCLAVHWKREEDGERE